MYGCMDVWMDVWMYEWMHGCMKISIYVIKCECMRVPFEIDMCFVWPRNKRPYVQYDLVYLFVQ